MNTKNAAGFFFLGLVMQVAPTFAPSLAAHADSLANESVRALWLQFMGLVIGGIGSGYLIRDFALRVPAMISPVLPKWVLSPLVGRAREARIPSAARVGV